ncbi:MAG: hypothetical protein LBD03_09940 [Methanobrevibacter sp.]|nr:hypothetical protein [Candidatus Methanovirga procula]
MSNYYVFIDLGVFYQLSIRYFSPHNCYHNDFDRTVLFVSLNKPHKILGIGGVETMLRKLGIKLNINKVHPHKSEEL